MRDVITSVITANILLAQSYMGSLNDIQTGLITNPLILDTKTLH